MGPRHVRSGLRRPRNARPNARGKTLGTVPSPCRDSQGVQVVRMGVSLQVHWGVGTRALLGQARGELFEVFRIRPTSAGEVHGVYPRRVGAQARWGPGSRGSSRGLLGKTHVRWGGQGARWGPGSLGAILGLLDKAHLRWGVPGVYPRGLGLRLAGSQARWELFEVFRTGPGRDRYPGKTVSS